MPTESESGYYREESALRHIWLLVVLFLEFVLLVGSTLFPARRAGLVDPVAELRNL
jgi:ABC-type lipoprotein release transport system permease subunit